MENDFEIDPTSPNDDVANLQAAGEDYDAQGRYPEAEQAFQGCVGLLEAAGLAETDDFAALLNQLADVRFAQGKYDGETEALYQRSIALFESVNGPVHADVANVLSNLAALHQERVNYRNAENASRRAVAILEAIFNTPDLLANYDVETIDVLLSMHQGVLVQLSTALRAQGRYELAEPPLLQALTLAKEIFGPESSEYGMSLNNLGVLYKYWGRYDEALTAYQQARAIIEDTADDGQLNLATLLYNLAGLDHARGRYTDAEPLCRQALSLQQIALGPEHPSLAVTQATLAAILDGQQKFDEAESLYQHAMATHIATYGPEHPEVALILNNLGAIAEARGNPAEAEEFYTRSLAMRERFLGQEHPQVATSLNNLAMLHKSIGNTSAAAALFERAIAILESTCGPAHPNTLACRESYASLKT